MTFTTICNCPERPCQHSGVVHFSRQRWFSNTEITVPVRPDEPQPLQLNRHARRRQAARAARARRQRS